MREDLASAVAEAWSAIGRAGTWLTGAERVQVAAETRAAPECRLCAARAAAVSPYGIDGAHDRATDLPDAWIEAIHRIRTDPGRLTSSWLDRVRQGGLDETHYVELVSITVIVTGIDTFRRTAGLAPLPLPEVVPGRPTKALPQGAAPSSAWVRHLAPRDVGPEDPPLYADRAGAHIHRALSLVPRSMMHFWDLFERMYLPQAAMREFDREFRAIDHAQIEMLAARVAALNHCTY